MTARLRLALPGRPEPGDDRPSRWVTVDGWPRLAALLIGLLGAVLVGGEVALDAGASVTWSEPLDLPVVAGGVTATLLGGLVHALRYRARRHVVDLRTAVGLVAVGGGTLAVHLGWQHAGGSGWGQAVLGLAWVLCHLVLGVLLAAPGPSRAPRHPTRWRAVLVVGATVAAVAAAVALWVGVVGADHPAPGWGVEALAAEVVAVGSVASLLLGVMVVLRRADRTREPLHGWLAIGVALLGVTVAQATAGPVGTQAVPGGGLFWLAGAVAVMQAAVRGLLDEGGAMTRAVVAEQHRALAGVLHDGLAQELALLCSQSRFLARRYPEDRAHFEMLGQAAQRALEESRAVIAVLRGEGVEPPPERRRDVRVS